MKKLFVTLLLVVSCLSGYSQCWFTSVGRIVTIYSGNMGTIIYPADTGKVVLNSASSYFVVTTSDNEVKPCPGNLVITLGEYIEIGQFVGANEDGETTRHDTIPISIGVPPGDYTMYLRFQNSTSGTVLDAVNVSIKSTLGVEQLAPTGSNATIYPIPASDIVHVALRDPQGNIKQLRILDITGKCLKIANPVVSNAIISVQVGDLPTGIYMLELLDIDGRRSVLRMAKQ